MLVVDVEPAMRSMLRTALLAQGYQVTEAATGREARSAGMDEPLQLCLIDPGLPDVDGLALLPELRSRSNLPIIVLGTSAQEARQVRALDAGADDYLVKPVPMGVLMARIRALLRRAGATGPGLPAVWRLGSTVVDTGAHTVRRQGRDIALSGVQWRVLEALCRHAGRTVTTRQLLREVWGPEHDGHAHYLRVYVHRLRQALEPEPGRPVYIVSEPGLGYRFTALPDEAAGDRPGPLSSGLPVRRGSIGGPSMLP